MVHDLKLLSNSFVARRPRVERERARWISLSGPGKWELGNGKCVGELPAKAGKARAKLASIVSMLTNLSQQMSRLDSRNLWPLAHGNSACSPRREKQINIEQVVKGGETEMNAHCGGNKQKKTG